MAHDEYIEVEVAYGEIAAVMDCPEGTVKTRMYHARKQLNGWVRESSP